MKLKEWPASLYQEFKLRLTPVSKFINPKAEVLPVIVSLTTIESRLSIIHITLKSILAQTHVPEKIILWVNTQLKDSLPTSLLELEESPLFEIRYNNYTCPHRKLLSTLECFNNSVIVTIDDDIIYAKNWLNSLYQSHLANPNCIVANTVRTIKYKENNEVAPYAEWKHSEKKNYILNLPIGFNGILYPPNSLHEDALNWSLALSLAPNADDLWYKAMSLKKGVESIISDYPTMPYPLRDTQRISLRKSNVKQDKNRIQWQKLSDYFNLPEIIASK